MATPKPSVTNCPDAFVWRVGVAVAVLASVSVCVFFLSLTVMSPISGGYSAGVPPLPIPNRAVKPGRADGTA